MGRLIVVSGNPPVAPLWAYADNALLTLPRAHLDDSGSFSATPTSGTVHYTYFVAQESFTCAKVNFCTGGTGPSSSTLAKVGLYSVNSSTLALTLMSASTNQTSWSGTYTNKNIALAEAQSLTLGGLYAIGNLQVATTPASLLGAWDNLAYANPSPRMAGTHGSQADLPSSDTDGSISTHQFPMAYILKAS